jgi:hypothetical protein
MNIIQNLLLEEPYKSGLSEYTYVSNCDIVSIPLGSHIKVIDRNENLKSIGFLIKPVHNKDFTKRYLIIKSNVMYKIYYSYYWVFYKKPNVKSKRNTFLKLLESLDES